MPRYSDSTLRGMLLEEAILYILSKTGYAPIFKKNGDPSLNDGSSGLEVLGRGARHQIDAVADFLYTPPFCNQQRLLIEAKFKGSKTGIDIVRNATGVHKDVSEYWVVDNATGTRIAKKRFHYLYAIFSKEPFTKPAQDYAYAQDIFLLPLKNNTLFQPIIRAIDNVSFDGAIEKPKLSTVRQYIRSRLFESITFNAEVDEDMDVTALFWELLGGGLDSLINICHSRGFGFITMFDGKFPVFLTASRGLDTFIFNEVNHVKIKVSDGAWLIESQDGIDLFAFDLPEEIFERYQKSGVLSRRQLLNIKENHMSEFYVFVSQDGDLKIIKFKLDQLWFELISQSLGDR